MKQLFFTLCKLFGKKDRLVWVEPAAIMITLLLAIILHVFFLLFIFEFEMTFLVEEYGTPLLLGILFIFSSLYFFLVSKFKKYEAE